MAEEQLPIVDPVEAIAYFRAKGYEIGFDWRDVWQEEHARAFTVAKAMSRDLLEDIRAAVDTALSEGQTLEQFTAELKPRLVARGWWGRRRIVDPASGEEQVAMLGSPARLRTIYQTNLRTSYMAGRWQRIERSKRAFPLLRYISVMDGRERPEHHAWHDTILPVDDPWWDTHYPPCGWNCRCDAQPLNERMLARRGWKVTEQPVRFEERDHVNRRTGEVTRLEGGIDPGWSYNVGKASLDGLVPSALTGRIERDVGGNTTISEADFVRLKPFFEKLGIETREAAVAGRVFLDAAGWPLPVSTGLLRKGNGQLIDIDAELARELKEAASVIAESETISWVWVRTEGDKPLLVRRYTSSIGTVDVGRSFWRWKGGRQAAAQGRVVWTADKLTEDGELVGARERVRFLAMRVWAGSKAPETVRLGPVPDRVYSAAAEFGLAIRSRTVAVRRQEIRHINRRHGPQSGDGLPIEPEDVALAMVLLRKGRLRPGSDPTHRKTVRAKRIVATATIGEFEYEAVFEPERNKLALYSLYKTRKVARGPVP